MSFRLEVNNTEKSESVSRDDAMRGVLVGTTAIVECTDMKGGSIEYQTTCTEGTEELYITGRWLPALHCRMYYIASDDKNSTFAKNVIF